ncbi:hypothetical protein N8633_02975 [bacterium]|nr:hypothetical protein [bacterium]
MKELKQTVQNTEKGTARVQQISPSPRAKSRLSKSHVDHWHTRVRKRTFRDRKSGNMMETPEWYIRLKKGQRQEWFNLQTSNQAVAARKAKDIHTCLQANDWNETLAKFKPQSDAPSRVNLNIGDYLAAVSETEHLKPRTFLNYQNSFRTIVGECFGIQGDKSKFDYRTGGSQKWAAKIDVLKLDRVTPERITAWQRQRVKKAGNSPVAKAAAKRTANSYVRCARSLFSKGVLKKLKNVEFPAVLPFEGVELFDSGSVKYISKVDDARKELSPSAPEAYKIFLLGLFAGMRKGEIDLAEWRMIDWQNHLIRLEETEWLSLKTNDSAGEITVDPEMMEDLKELKSRTTGPFIVYSNRRPRNDSARSYYRCQPSFDRLNEWLRSKGVTANKPLHELRKEIGALIATKHGIYAASRFLRHSDITTTARHYAEHKTRISVGLGKILDEAK